ncbi:MAG: hypothetical protein EBU90_00790 [Proteobacteria bacterium]|nr:hypothetical protein [Pseudomonadota bacterium]NBP12969.1 hypothetical protein [bacterium]
MELNELQQRLLEKLESISTDDILKAIFSIEGQPSFTSVNKIQELRDSILGSAEHIAEEVSKKANSTDIVFDTLGIPKDNSNAKALDLIRQDTWQQIAEVNKKIREKYNISDEALKHMADPFALNETRENSRKLLNQRFLEIKDKLESADLSIVPFELINQPKLNQLVKYEPREDEEKEKKITPYEVKEIPVLDKLNEIYTTKLDDILKLLEDRQNKLLKDKEPETTSVGMKFYEPEEKTFTLNQKQFSDIINAINLSSQTQKKVLDEILDVEKERNASSRDSEDSKPSGFLDNLLKLGSVLSAAALGLGILAEPLAKMVDSMFGTKLETIVERIKNNTGLDQRRFLDIAKWAYLGIRGAKNVKRTTGSLMTSGGREALREAGAKSLSKTTPRWKAIGRMVTGKAKEEAVIAEESAAAATRASSAVKATGAVGETAVKASKTAGLLSKITSPATTSLLRGITGGFLRKIPILGGLIDLGIAMDSFSKGDTTGGIISVLSAATNLLYLLGPEMAVVAIPIQMGLSALDWFLTSQAGGDIKQKQNVIPNMISGFFGGSKKPKTEKPDMKPKAKEISVTSEENKQIASQISSQETEEVIEMGPEGSRVITRPKLINPENEKNYRILKPISEPTSPTVRDIASVPQPTFSSTVSLDNQSLEKLSSMLSKMTPSPVTSVNIGGGGGGGSQVALSSERDGIYEGRRRRKPLHIWDTTNPSTY